MAGEEPYRSPLWVIDDETLTTGAVQFIVNRPFASIFNCVRQEPITPIIFSFDSSNSGQRSVAIGSLDQLVSSTALPSNSATIRRLPPRAAT